jgi:hypothetical protein
MFSALGLLHYHRARSIAAVIPRAPAERRALFLDATRAE